MTFEFAGLCVLLKSGDICSAGGKATTFVALADHWQTLISGLLALLAALATIIVMLRQTEIQKRQYESIQKKKAWATRSRLPDALSAINDYASRIQSGLVVGEVTAVAYPFDAIRELQDAIEYSEEKAAKRLFEIVCKAQVQKSRISKYRKPRGKWYEDLEVQEYIYDVVFLTALANSLFEFARDEKDCGPNRDINRNEMQSALSNCVGLSNYADNKENYSSILVTIIRRHN